MSAEKIEVSNAAQQAAERVKAVMAELCEADGMTWPEALAGAHAEIVIAMVLAIGGSETAARCRHAATQVENIPTLEQVIEKAARGACRP
ncbi:hypothetical protein TW83_12225 [Paracoccus sp. S4493]|uniref:hypothetical protein n=1 Tax=Paracoccus sp. S4493 TaxID=579490 RepID=UPI0005FA1A9F|nr:hypothetical protein [Paracoccus sp. S4493]KJZ30815.1 hypothetical protein TW83_12225 [Paracoccus sp. S4493]